MFNVETKSSEAKIINDITSSMLVGAMRLSMVTNGFTASAEELSKTDSGRSVIAIAAATRMNECCGVLKILGADMLIQYFKHTSGEVSDALYWSDDMINLLNRVQAKLGLDERLERELNARSEAADAKNALVNAADTKTKRDAA